MGPLAGVKVIEIAGLGAAPYGCMMLADMGADVVRIERLTGSGDTPEFSPLLRNRRSMALDLKKPQGRDLVLAMVEKADVLIEGFRPGVAERLGHRSGGVLRAQCAARLRTHDRLGADRTAGPIRGARSQLHRADRPSASDRSDRR